jgi:hypothetical protein
MKHLFKTRRWISCIIRMSTVQCFEKTAHR